MRKILDTAFDGFCVYVVVGMICLAISLFLPTWIDSNFPNARNLPLFHYDIQTGLLLVLMPVWVFVSAIVAGYLARQPKQGAVCAAGGLVMLSACIELLGGGGGGILIIGLVIAPIAALFGAAGGAIGRVTHKPKLEAV